MHKRANDKDKHHNANDATTVHDFSSLSFFSFLLEEIEKDEFSLVGITPFICFGHDT